tara:strand:- start:225 stop:554 length:330 start_codon:yes stop_codon:yes gene_type:complete
MARPLKKVDDKQSAVITIRCSFDEKNLIKGNAERAGLSLSDYMRQMGANGKIIIRQNMVELGLAGELRKIGVNLNQQTRNFNASGKPPIQLEQTWLKLENLIDKLLSGK